MVVDLRSVAYGSDDAQLLTAEVQAEYVRRYGGEGDTAPVDTTEFEGDGGAFFVLYVDDVPAAMGGWRRHGAEDAEIKRMFVRAQFQRQGLARLILHRIEESAAAAGVSRLVLETGFEQPEAIALYRSSGYVDVEPFGHYVGYGEYGVHLGRQLGPA